MAKKATTIKEQLKLLKSRGMEIADEGKASEVLLDIGFYRLGFYAFPFEKTYPRLSNRDHLFKPNTSFNDVLDLYYFDYDLRRLLTNVLNRIEVNLRTYITYTVSNHYKESPIWFMDTNVMKSSYIHDFEEKVYKTIREVPVIKRHHQKYINDRFAPAWKTVEFMTLGNLNTLFLNLKNEDLQKEIARHYGLNLWIFINYLETIRIIRNACAHGNCIYSISLARAIKSSAPVPISGDTRHNINGIINVIRYFIGKISQNRLNDFNDELNRLLEKQRSQETKEIIEHCTGFTPTEKEKVCMNEN